MIAGQCLSYCSLAVRRHHGQGIFKKEAFNWEVLKVSEGESTVIQVRSMQAWQQPSRLGSSWVGMAAARQALQPPGRHGAEAVAESSHLIHRQQAEKERECKTWLGVGF